MFIMVGTILCTLNVSSKWILIALWWSCRHYPDSSSVFQFSTHSCGYLLPLRLSIPPSSFSLLHDDFTEKMEATRIVLAQLHVLPPEESVSTWYYQPSLVLPWMRARPCTCALDHVCPCFPKGILFSCVIKLLLSAISLPTAYQHTFISPILKKFLLLTPHILQLPPQFSVSFYSKTPQKSCLFFFSFTEEQLTNIIVYI